MATISATAAPNPNVLPFLDLISWSEDSDYNTIVTGVDGRHTFTDFSDHPFAPQFGRSPVTVRRVPLLVSTASGRYQVLYHYFEVYKAQLGLLDFSPLSQDLVAIQQMRERGALGFLAAGQIASAIEACSNIWASFPGNNYGQGGHSLDVLLNKFNALQSSMEAA